jgi:hypothetical protein
MADYNKLADKVHPIKFLEGKEANMSEGIQT